MSKRDVGKRDYYEVLGVGRDVDEPGLKTAYRKKAMQHHPDRNPGDAAAEEKFKEAAEAYSVLSDSQKRAVYDRFGHQGLQGGAAPSFDPSVFSDFNDIFGSLFGFEDFFGGGRRRGNRPQRGEDLRFDLEIDFEDAIRGKSVDLQIPRLETCSHCRGSGAEAKDGLVTCPLCRGRGEVVYQQSFLSIRRTCGQCGGRGQIVRRPCTHCRGEGRVRTERKLKITIPPGVDNGTHLRVTGEGQPGPGGNAAGDLFVVLRVKEHAIFQREGDDLHCVVPINLAQAALGTQIDLLTFDGLQTLKLPESTQHGAQFKMKGLGTPRLSGGGRGDLYVHVEIRVPTRLSRDQRKLFEQLAQILPAENEPKERGLFEKVKDSLGL